MNFGTQQIQDIIYQQLKRAGYKAGIPYGKFAKDTAKIIYDLIGDEDMNFDMEQQARARGASAEQVDAWSKVCKAFDRTMPMRPIDWNVYLWIIEQNNTGKNINGFVRWAKSSDQLPYINQYIKNPENIKMQWERAFLVDTKDERSAMIRTL